jgi:methyl-accepting chemotaxis protein
VVFIFVMFYPFYYDLYSGDSLWAQYASAEVWLRLIERGAGVIALVLVISIFHNLMFSHRICGPLVNLNHTLHAIAQGDISREVYLRRKDFLKEEAIKINQMLTSLNQRIAALKSSHAAISDLSEKLPSGLIEDQLKELLKSHNKLLDQWVLK